MDTLLENWKTWYYMIVIPLLLLANYLVRYKKRPLNSEWPIVHWPTPTPDEVRPPQIIWPLIFDFGESKFSKARKATYIRPNVHIPHQLQSLVKPPPVFTLVAHQVDEAYQNIK